MSKSVGNIFLLHEALERWGRDTLIMYFLGGHYHQPVEFDEERLEQAAASVRRIREAGAKARTGPLAGLVVAPCERPSSMRWPRTSTRPGRCRSCSSGSAGPIGAPTRWDPAISGRC